MDYGEVQRYSTLYDAQDLYATQRRRILEHVAQALSIVGTGFPNDSTTKDLEALRGQINTLQADFIVLDQLGRQLLDSYRKALK
jgi:hypothetical protein